MFEWVDSNLRYLNRTQPIPGYGAPSVTAVDGTFAMDNDEGFIFLFNAGPLARNATLTVDEMIGLTNQSVAATWLVNELYPLEHNDGGWSPVATWHHVCVYNATELCSACFSCVSSLHFPAVRTASRGAMAPFNSMCVHRKHAPGARILSVW